MITSSRSSIVSDGWSLKKVFIAVRQSESDRIHGHPDVHILAEESLSKISNYDDFHFHAFQQNIQYISHKFGLSYSMRVIKHILI